LIAVCRTILAAMIALAVAVAPVAAASVGGVRAASAAAVHDCQHMASQHPGGGMRDMPAAHHNHDGALQVGDNGGCPDCSPKRDAKCFDDGKCCKLTGVVAVLPTVTAPAESSGLAANPPTLIGWQMRPPPPPPRT
jgi:hypothetical protein